LGTHRVASDDRTPSPEARIGTKFARVLWVDDHPDNNLYETVALENLGKFVTKTTSTQAAMVYLSKLKFDLALTDLGRSGNPLAGLDFVRQARMAHPQLPLVVYTMDAARHRQDLVETGADAVVDRPDALVAAVETHTPSMRSGKPAAVPGKWLLAPRMLSCLVWIGDPSFVLVTST
jgi:CheY-like chemotaxis protein